MTRFGTAARAAAALLAGLALSGCGNNMSDLRSYVEDVKSRKSSDIEPIPQIKAYQPFTYREQGRRNPFVAVVTTSSGADRASSGVQPDFNRNREPLEEFPLDSLRMAGTLDIAGRRYALVQAPDNVVHRVRVGNHMGENFGQIVSIGDTRIQLIEIVPDGMGGYMKSEAALAQSE
jgi:type IV pilus assembly protein PilP